MKCTKTAVNACKIFKVIHHEVFRLIDVLNVVENFQKNISGRAYFQ